MKKRVLILHLQSVENISHVACNFIDDKIHFIPSFIIHIFLQIIKYCSCQSVSVEIVIIIMLCWVRCYWIWRSRYRIYTEENNRKKGDMEMIWRRDMKINCGELRIYWMIIWYTSCIASIIFNYLWSTSLLTHRHLWVFDFHVCKHFKKFHKTMKQYFGILEVQMLVCLSVCVSQLYYSWLQLTKDLQRTSEGLWTFIY